MKIGYCVNMVAADASGIGLDRVATLAGMGYDYVEMPMAQMMCLDDAQFQSLLEQVHRAGIPCEACNNFIQPHIRLTGPDTDTAQVRRYLEKAIARADALGAKRIVFGSAGARNVPQGFPRDRAWSQLIDLLRLIDSMLADKDIIIVIEPLNRGESNIVNSVSEGLMLAKDTDRPHIRLLADYYHMALEREGLEVITQAGNFLRHAHIANPDGRIVPAAGDASGYDLFVRALHGIGYKDRISVEAYASDFEGEGKASLLAMRSVT